PFRIPCFEELLNTWQTLRNIVSGNAPGMECTHRQLGTRLTNRLGSDNANCFPDFNMSTRRQIAAVAFLTYSVTRTTAKHGTDLKLLDSCIDNRICLVGFDQFIASYDHFTRLRMTDRFECVASFNTVI